MATPRQKTNWGFSLALGLLLLIGAAAYISIQRLVTAEHQVADALRFATALEGLTTRLGEAEGAVRGFLITGNRQYVDRHDAAVRQLSVQLADLRARVARDSVGASGLGTLEPLVARRVDVFRASIAARAAPGTPAVEIARLTAHGDDFTDQIRAAVRSIEREDRAAWAARAAVAGRSAVAAKIVIALAVLLGLLAVAAAMVAVNRDFAARARATEALREVEERNRVVLDTAKDGIIALDERGTIEGLNPAAARIFGYEAASLIGTSLTALLTGPYAGAPAGYLTGFARPGEEHLEGRIVEVTGRRRDGALFPLELSLGEVQLPHRKLYTAVFRDIAERRNLEDTLRATLELQRAVLDAANNSFISTDADGLILTFNVAAERWLGYRADEVIGRQTPVIFHDPQEVERRAAELTVEFGTPFTPGFRVFVEEARRGLRSQREWTYVRRDGTRFPVLLSIAALRNASGLVAGFLCVASDLSEQKAAERALREHQAHLQDFLDNAHDLILSTGPDDRLLYVNRAWERALGYTGAGVLGHQVFEFLAEECLEVCRATFARVISGESVTHFEATFVARDGRHVEVSGSSNCRFEDGRPVSTRSIFRNITEIRRVQAALERARDEAQRASRAKSDFLANMSHELRTPLNSVIGFASVLLMNPDGKLTEQDLDFLGRIRDNGKHLLALINSILDLSKIEAGKIELEITEVPLDQLIRETLGLVGGTEQGEARRVGDVDVRGDVPANVRPIRTDAGKLKQVLINLIGNALKFTPRGSVTLRVVADAATGVAERIDVVDTGIGIPKDRQEAIFEAFQQVDANTSRKYGGTGLGLTICRSLLELMGYRISVASELGEGSTFSVHLGGRGTTD
jgi:PAS domain S-box-containing protein